VRRTFSIPRSYLTACRRALPAENRGTRRFGMLIATPVWGLRAMRALRFEILKVPNPTNDTWSPCFNDFVMPSMIESPTAAALAFFRPVSFATFAMMPCLFMRPFILRGLLPSKMLDRLLQDRIGRRRRLPEFHVGIIDHDGRLEPFFVQRRSRRR